MLDDNVLIIIIAISVCAAADVSIDAAADKYEQVSGAFITEEYEQNLTPYVTSFQLNYQSKLPSLPSEHVSNLIKGKCFDNQVCLVESWLLRVLKNITFSVQKQNVAFSLSWPNERENRQPSSRNTDRIMISTWEWNDVLEEVRIANSNLNNFRVTSIPDSLLGINRNKDSIADFLDKQQNLPRTSSSSSANDTWQTLRTLSFVLAALEKNSEIIATGGSDDIVDECKERRIPSTVVPVEQLRNDLVKMQQMALRDGYELAIPVEHVHDYYVKKMGRCVVNSNGDILVRVTVPLKKRNEEWKLHRLHTGVFQRGNSICRIPSLPERVAISENDVIHPVNPDEIDENGMWRITRIQSNDTVRQCLRSLLRVGATDVTTACPMKCSATPTDGATHVVQIDQDDFLVTNPTEYMSVVCGKSPRQLSYEKGEPGAEFVHLPCGCSLSLGYRVVIGAQYPCESDDSGDDSPAFVKHVVPVHFSQGSQSDVLQIETSDKPDSPLPSEAALVVQVEPSASVGCITWLSLLTVLVAISSVHMTVDIMRRRSPKKKEGSNKDNIAQHRPPSSPGSRSSNETQYSSVLMGT